MSSFQFTHHNLLTGLLAALEENFFRPNAYADKVLEKTFRQHKKWGKKDRAMVAELFYGVVRWKRRLEFYAKEPITPQNVAFFLLLYMEWAEIEYKDFKEFSGYRVPVFKKEEKKSAFTPAVKHSVPDWLYETLEKETGKAGALLHQLNQQANVTLRINRLKTNDEELEKLMELHKLSYRVHPDFPDALFLTNRQNIFQSEIFQQGLVEVQDAGSQAISHFLQAEPGMRVIDACAGGGGKSLHLAAIMQNKGQIISMDIFQWKLAEIKKRAKRAGAFNIEPRFIENNKTVKRLAHKADRLLLDVPCSGTGVLRRNPDAKWKMTPERLENIHQTQREILQNYAEMMKPGGKMVYATCSVLPSENQDQVTYFLSQNPEYRLEAEVQLDPSEAHDGFYMARIIRG